MLCDFYELTMGNGYYRNGFYKRNVYFDVFFRNVPDGGGFAIAAGLEQIVEYIQQLHFSDDDIAYLRGKGFFDEGFLNYLKNFKFHGDIYAVPEGTPVFPGEPLLTVRAPAIEAQLIETYLLLEINHQSLIATKANRIVRAAQGRAVLEFGSRRAQGADGAVIGARAAYIGGVAGTACTLTDVLYGVPAGGTMAHSWVQMFDSEYEAFKAYCETYPTNATLLVDTYNSLKSGVPNAIRAFNEVLKPLGITKCGIRFDSGDMAYLTRKARAMLDEKHTGYPDSFEDKTIIIECARGGPDGSSMPLTGTFGYQYSLPMFCPEILENAVILYIWVTPEESRRKNADRADPNDPGSNLHHGVPMAVMLGDYGCDDMEYLVQHAEVKNTVTVKAHGKTYNVPIGIFDNRVDKTSFLRAEPSEWDAGKVEEVTAAIRQATDTMYANYNK